MMTQCPTTDKLKLLSGGQLTEQDSDVLLLHLQSCDDCQAEIGTLDHEEDTFIGDLKRLQTPDAAASDLAMEPGYRAATAKALAAIGSLETSEQTADLPQEFGDYKIVRSIGRGGMGSVYLGRHAKLDRSVAIKILAKHRRWDEVMHERFEAEMRVIGGLNHPNIVAAHDAREVDGVAVLVTEYIDGLNVSELMKRTGRLDIPEACAIGAKICSALSYIGQKNLVHRDIKPSNIMVSTDGQVKLLDLGLTRLQSADDQPADYTATGQAIGTADYVSPEQIKDGRNVDFRADLYGLGCTLFKMLTGVAPFSGQEHATAFAKMNAHVSDVPLSISSLRPDIPAQLSTLVQQLLEKSPANRPQSATEVEAILSEFGSEKCLQPLVGNAMNLSLLEAGLNSQSSMKSLASSERTKPWWSRRFPAWAMVAAGLGGIAIGMLLGVKLTIKKPDGTTATVTIPDGSVAEVDANGDVTLQLEGQGDQKVGEGAQRSDGIMPLIREADDADQKRLQGVWRTVLSVEKGPLKNSPPQQLNLFIGGHLASTRNNEDFDDERLLVGKYNLLFDPKTQKRLVEANAGDNRKKAVPYSFINDEHFIFDVEDNESQGVCRVFAEQVGLPRTSGEAIFLHANKTLLSDDGRIFLAIAKRKPGVPDTKQDLTVDDLEIDPIQRITQRDFVSAAVTTDQEGMPALSFEMSKASASKLSEITKNNFRQMLAIFIDGELISAPTIQSQISSRGTISGDFSKEELEPIAAAINDYSIEIKSHIIAAKRLAGLSLAILNFESDHGYFPSSKNTILDEKPSKPHSWRVAILPYIGERELFDRYRFDEDWDSEKNTKLLSEMPDLFRCSNGDDDSTTTGYLGIADEHATFGGSNKKLENFTDGTSDTVAILQTDREVPWTKPEDLKLSDELIDELMQKNFPFSTVDGALHSIPKAKLNKQLLKNLITMDDGNPVKIPGETRPLSDGSGFQGPNPSSPLLPVAPEDE